MSTDMDIDGVARPLLRLLNDTDPAPLTPDGDAETYTDADEPLGAPVDAPDAGMGLSWADPAARTARLPLLPGWMADRATMFATCRAVADVAWYHVRFHGLRGPGYAVKTVWYAPIGAVRTVARLLRWASAEQHNFGLRQRAADGGDAYTW